MTSGGSEERLCIAFQLQLAEVLQMPGKAALWGLFVALLEAGEMAFLGVLEVSEESSSGSKSSQTAKQTQTLLMLHITGIRGTCEWSFAHGSLTEGMVTAVGRGLELLSGGIHMGKPGIKMMPLLINNG